MSEPAFAVAPYFDVLLQRLEDGDARAVTAFGRHVHWGWWPDAAKADGTPEDYAAAAERLCVKVCDAAGIRDGMKVLDVGCGLGGTIASLNDRYKNLELTGVNIDPRQLARAAKTIVAKNGNRIQWVEADACALPFPSSSFDAVLAVECIFHFPSRATFLREAFKVMAPGAKLAISDFVPPAENMSNLAKHAPGQDEATRLSYGKVDLLCPIEQYETMALAAGLSLESTENISAGTLPTYEYLRADQKGWRDRATAKVHEKATTRLEMAARLDLLRYSVLSFRRPAVAARQAG